MEFNNKVPEWNNEGTAPSEELKSRGFVGGYKPPASVFNYMYNRYSKCIKEVQDKLANTEEDIENGTVGLKPSEVAEGKGISIKNSANLPFIELNVYGKSKQDTLNGYQLFDASKIATYEGGGATVTNNEDGTFTVSGSGDISEVFHRYYEYSHEDTVDLLKAGDVRLIAGAVTYPYVYAQIRTSSDTLLELSASSGESVTKQITEEMLNDETAVLRIGFYGSPAGSQGGVITTGTIKPMLYQEGSGEWEVFTNGKQAPNPDYPIEINSVGDSGKLDISIATKNLFDKNAYIFVDGKTINNDTGELKDTTANGWRTFEELIMVEPNTAYILSGGIVPNSWTITVGFYNSNKEFITYTKVTNYGGVNSFKFTTPENTAYLRFNAHLDTLDVDTIQLEEGTSVTDYVSANTQTLTLSTPNGLAGIPVSSGGNYTDENGQQWICDEIDLARGVYVQRVNKYVLTGTETMSRDARNGDTYRWFFSIENRLPSKETIDGLCSHFDYNLAPIGNNDMDCSFNVYSLTGNVYGRYDAITTLEEMATWLAGQYANGTPVTIQYILKTPIETALTPAEIKAYKTLTTTMPNTTILNDSMAEMKVEYVTQQYDSALGMVLENASPNNVLTTDDVVDNLESTASNLPLSANQGRALNASKANVNLSNITNSVFLSKGVSSGLGRVELKSYTGNGKYGSSNPTSVTFSFTPMIVMMVAINSPTNHYNVGFNATLGRQIMTINELSTTYGLGLGFCCDVNSQTNVGNQCYGKKSSDGKTIYWYTGYNNTSWGPVYQCNDSDTTYYLLAIG